MDYKKIVCELFRALRGETSQTIVNKRLNYSYNQVSRWESGKVQPSWEDFLNFLKALKIDISPQFGEYFRFHGDLMDYPEIIDFALGSTPINQISNQLRIAKSTLYSWKKRERVPPLYQMLRIIGHSLFNIDYFLDQITQGRILPTLRATRDQRQQINKLATDHPMAIGVAMCLDLGSYKALEAHQDGYLANKLNISIEEEEFYLEILREAGLLSMDEKGLYQVDMGSITVGGSWDDIYRVRKFWLMQSVKKMEHIYEVGNTDQIFPYIFTVFQGNREFMNEVKDKMNKLYAEVNAMAEAYFRDHSEKTDQLCFFNMGLSWLSGDLELKRDLKPPTQTPSKD